VREWNECGGPLDFGAITYGRNIHYFRVILKAARVTHWSDGCFCYLSKCAFFGFVRADLLPQNLKFWGCPGWQQDRCVALDGKAE
jgi:hypothetical protein